MRHVIVNAARILDFLKFPTHLIKSFRFAFETVPKINHEYHDGPIFGCYAVKVRHEAPQSRVVRCSTIPIQSAVDHDAWKPGGKRSARHDMVNRNLDCFVTETFKYFIRAFGYLRRT